jgi:hypothetical protein
MINEQLWVDYQDQLEQFLRDEVLVQVPDAALDAYQLQAAWEELQSVPSYVEQQARAFASEK